MLPVNDRRGQKFKVPPASEDEKNFLRLSNKTFLDWSTRNQNNYSQKRRILTEAKLVAVTADCEAVEGSQATGAIHATAAKVFQICQQSKVK